MFKAGNRSTRTWCEICSINSFTPCSGAAIVKFDKVNAVWLVRNKYYVP